MVVIKVGFGNWMTMVSFFFLEMLYCKLVSRRWIVCVNVKSVWGLSDVDGCMLYGGCTHAAVAVAV